MQYLYVFIWDLFMKHDTTKILVQYPLTKIKVVSVITLSVAAPNTWSSLMMHPVQGMIVSFELGFCLPYKQYAYNLGIQQVGVRSVTSVATQLMLNRHTEQSVRLREARYVDASKPLEYVVFVVVVCFCVRVYIYIYMCANRNWTRFIKSGR